MHANSPNPKDVILDVQNVWKIYCRNLKRAMWYGLRDLGREMIGGGHDRLPSDLRPGEFFAVRDANFQIGRGECVAMLGPNGAGKSTMLKMINGLVKPNAGRITIDGRVAALIELGTGFNPVLSGRENVYINASVLGMRKWEVDRIFDEIVEFAELGHVIDDPVKTYSSGMKVRLGFSVAANLRPDLLIMDEVLAVGDVGFRMKCFAHLRQLIDDGVSIVLVTHAVGMLPRVATRAIVFGRGKIVFDGDLSTGTTVYEEMMNAKPVELQRKQKESATPDAIIESVEVLNSQGQGQEEFNTDESLLLRIQVRARKAIPGARLIVALWSPVHGVLASMSSAYQDLRLDLAPGSQAINLRLKKLPLLIGAYHFNVSLMGPTSIEFYQRRTVQGVFRVTGPPIDADGYGLTGIVKLPHEWVME